MTNGQLLEFRLKRMGIQTTAEQVRVLMDEVKIIADFNNTSLDDAQAAAETFWDTTPEGLV